MSRWFVLGLAVLLLAACAPFSSGDGEGLQYTGPVEMGVEEGDFLPGTDIQFVRKTEDGAEVMIDGQQAVKKMGDSLNWKGDLMDGVAMDLSLRVTLIGETDMRVVGTIQITVVDPAPKVEPVNVLAPINYKVPVAYHVEKDGVIPGSVITYLGKTDEGAELGNIEGYAYRQSGDSIAWKGLLRDRVWIELSLRAVIISEGALDVVGTVELWIAP